MTRAAAALALLPAISLAGAQTATVDAAGREVGPPAKVERVAKTERTPKAAVPEHNSESRPERQQDENTDTPAPPGVNAAAEKVLQG